MDGRLYIWDDDKNRQFKMIIFSVEIYEGDKASSDYIKLEGEFNEHFAHPNQNSNLQSIIDEDAERVTVELTYTESGVSKSLGCFPKGSQIIVHDDEYTSIEVRDCQLWKKTLLANSED